MPNRCAKMLLCGLLSVVVSWALADASSAIFDTTNSEPTEVAARYHLRTRTSKFYQRSKTSQVRKAQGTPVASTGVRRVS